MVLELAEGGNLNKWVEKDSYFWQNDLHALSFIIKGLRKIHEKNMVHRDFHTGNILFEASDCLEPYISDLGLCGEVGNVDETSVYGLCLM